jgi:NADH dehydrogenase/Respiratory-chain NADH dehydrogenase, 49 Kd subunit
VLSAQRLHFAGVRGPVLRASERGDGDVQSRLVARLDAAVDDLARAVEALATGEVSLARGAEWQVPAGETSVVVQGPRGEIGLHMVSDGGESPCSIEWQRPSQALLPLLPEILAGQKLTAAYLVSYEVPIGFAAIGPVMAAQSLSTQRIVEEQAGLWYVVWQPLGLVIYLLAALFVTFRHPFDSAIAGDELEGGVFAEYAGPRLLLFKIALDAIFLILMGMGVVLFFGGWQGPWLPAPGWFVLKTFLLAAIVQWAARFLPGLRHDQVLSLSRKILLPASLLNITLVGMLALFIPGGGR